MLAPSSRVLALESGPATASTTPDVVQDTKPSEIAAPEKSSSENSESTKNLQSQILDLEKDAFSHAYETNTDEQRVIRLEHFVFGKQSTGDLAARLKRVRKAIAPRNANHFTISALGTGSSSSTGNANPNSPNKDSNPISATNSNLKNNTNSNPTSAANSNPTSAANSDAINIANVPTNASTIANPNATFPTFQSAADAPPTTPTDAPKTKQLSVIDLMNRGIDNYNRHRYSNADDDFEECCALAPGMSRCYAYLAITKLQLNLRQAAIDAFRMSTILDPFGAFGRYSRSCLIVLAGDEAMRKRPPVDSKQVLDSALVNIDKQSNELISRHRSAADQLANARLNYRTQISMVDARLESNSARTEGALRAAHAAESANNLKHILAVKKMPGDANLRAWGTTLTSRYYGNETYLNAPYYIPQERPMELKAIVQSLNSAHSAHTGHSAQGKHPAGKSHNGRVAHTPTHSLNSTHSSSATHSSHPAHKNHPARKH